MIFLILGMLLFDDIINDKSGAVKRLGKICEEILFLWAKSFDKAKKMCYYETIKKKGVLTMNTTLGKRIAFHRHNKELKQDELAEKVYVTRQAVSRWENGNNMPDLDILIEISDFYEVDLREILNGERKSGNMNKENNETNSSYEKI